ncbi:hypothetical protein OUZ56_011278 [Daphnia magna]|uniref:Uncharacterized protein n=1 Tax=Daphnia magna TaxID=35525 RepID=A0ABQ9Z031_9CRUS|nr:hypothetical protein OUZ56_011278 [Daphnia magna]
MDVGNFYKKETSLKEATSLETFLDSVSITRRYMVGKATHLKTTVYHASKKISTEADFQDIFKLQHYPYDLKPTVMQKCLKIRYRDGKHPPKTWLKMRQENANFKVKKRVL